MGGLLQFALNYHTEEGCSMGTQFFGRQAINPPLGGHLTISNPAKVTKIVKCFFLQFLLAVLIFRKFYQWAFLP